MEDNLIGDPLNLEDLTKEERERVCDEQFFSSFNNVCELNEVEQWSGLIEQFGRENLKEEAEALRRSEDFDEALFSKAQALYVSSVRGSVRAADLAHSKVWEKVNKIVQRDFSQNYLRSIKFYPEFFGRAVGLGDEWEQYWKTGDKGDLPKAVEEFSIGKERGLYKISAMHKGNGETRDYQKKFLKNLLNCATDLNGEKILVNIKETVSKEEFESIYNHFIQRNNSKKRQEKRGEVAISYGGETYYHIAGMKIPKLP